MKLTRHFDYAVTETRRSAVTTDLSAIPVRGGRLCFVSHKLPFLG